MGSNQYDIKVAVKTSGTQEFTKLGLEMTKLKKIDSFKKIGEQLRKNGQAYKEAQIGVGLLAKEIKASDKPTKAMNQLYSQAQKRVKKLSSEYKNSVSAFKDVSAGMKVAGINTRKLGDAQKQLEASAKKLRAETAKGLKISHARGLLDVRPYRDVQREIKQLEGAYKRLKNSGKLSAKELYKAQSQLNIKTAELKRSTNGWADSIAKAKGGLVSLAAMGYVVVKAFSTYSEYTQKMAEVNTLLDVSAEKHKKLGDEIIKLSTTIPQTASELAAAEYDILSAGVALEDSVRVLELSANAAVAGATDTKTAVNAGIGVLNAYGESVDNLEEVYDVLFMTVKKGVTTFPELSASIGEVLPTARSAGVDLKSVTAAIATMTKAGIRTPIATTALKGALNAMAAPTAEARKKFDELGITWNGLIPTIEAIKEKGLSLNELRMLIPDVEARTGVLALMQNMDGLNQSLHDMENAAGSMGIANAKVADTPTNEIIKFKNQINKLVVELSDLAWKVGGPVVDSLSSCLLYFDKADTATKIFIGTLAGAGVTFAAWNLGLGTIVLALKGMAINAKAAATANTALATSSKAAGLAMKAGIVLAAIAGTIELAKFVKVAYEWETAIWLAKKATKDAEKSEGELVSRLEETSKAIGYKIKSVQELTKLQKEGLIVFNQEILAWERTSEAAQKTSKATQFAAKLELEFVNARITAYEENSVSIEKYADLAIDIAQRKAKKEKSTEAELARAIGDINIEKFKQLLDLETQYANDIERIEGTGTENHKKAVAKKLETEKNFADFRKKTEEEITALLKKETDKRLEELSEAIIDEKLLYEQRVADIELLESRGTISHEDAVNRKKRLETAFLEKKVKDTELAIEETIKFYGKDSDEYKKAVRAKKQAEIDLTKARAKAASENKEISEDSTRAIKDQKEAVDDLGDSEENLKKKQTANIENFSMYISTYQHHTSTLKELNGELEKTTRLYEETASGIGMDVINAQYGETVKTLREMRGGYEEVAEAANRAGLDIDLASEAFQNMSLDGFTQDIDKRVKAFADFKKAFKDVAKGVRDFREESKDWAGGISEGVETAEKSFEKAKDGFKDTLADAGNMMSNFSTLSVSEASTIGQSMIASYAGMVEAGKAYIETMKEKWKSLGEEIDSIKEKITDLTKGTADSIRELERGVMDNQEAWNDKRKEYNEKYAEATKLMNKGMTDEAVELFKEAQSIAKSLASEIKNSSGEVLTSLEENTKTSVGLLEKAGDAAARALEKQSAGLASNMREARSEIAKTSDDLSSLTRFSSGSGLKFNTGGRVPGTGYGDTVPAMLTPNEFVAPVGAVNKYGVSFFEALRRRIIPADAVRALMGGRRYNLGGLVREQFRPNFSLPKLPEIQFLNSGGQVKEARTQVTERVQIDLSFGGKSYSGLFAKSDARGFINELKLAKARAL